MTHLYLIRHGNSVDDTVDGKSVDIGLSPEGVRQSELLRDRLQRTGEIVPDVFISSPERRAHETAKVLAPAFGIPFTLDEGVIEWRSDDGSIPTDEFMRRWNAVPRQQRRFYRFLEGHESLLEFTMRAHFSYNRILQEHAGKTIVIVTHGAFIQTSFSFFFRFSEANLEFANPEIKRTSITHWFQADPQDRWTLERSNDYHHLL